MYVPVISSFLLWKCVCLEGYVFTCCLKYLVHSSLAWPSGYATLSAAAWPILSDTRSSLQGYLLVDLRPTVSLQRDTLTVADDQRRSLE